MQGPQAVSPITLTASGLYEWVLGDNVHLPLKKKNLNTNGLLQKVRASGEVLYLFILLQTHTTKQNKSMPTVFPTASHNPFFILNLAGLSSIMNDISQMMVFCQISLGAGSLYSTPSSPCFSVSTVLYLYH